MMDTLRNRELESISRMIQVHDDTVRECGLMLRSPGGMAHRGSVHVNVMMNYMNSMTTVHTNVVHRQDISEVCKIRERRLRRVV
jgi:hypothetical protein